MTLHSEHNVSVSRCAEGTMLTDGTMHVSADFSRILARIKPGRLQGELVVKAARVKGIAHPIALDATAGMGEDALLLAAAGFTVHLYERNRDIATLLRAALDDAAEDPELAPIVARMHLHEQDSIPVLQSLALPVQGSGSAENTALDADADAAPEASDAEQPLPSCKPDVILLDPMFPARKKSAAVKKKFQLLHRLEAPCLPEEEEALLQAALAVHPAKVVVKRPVKGPHLCGKKPSYTLAGKAIRFDVYV